MKWFQVQAYQALMHHLKQYKKWCVVKKVVHIKSGVALFPHLYHSFSRQNKHGGKHSSFRVKHSAKSTGESRQARRGTSLGERALFFFHLFLPAEISAFKAGTSHFDIIFSGLFFPTVP